MIMYLVAILFCLILKMVVQFPVRSTALIPLHGIPLWNSPINFSICFWWTFLMGCTYMGSSPSNIFLFLGDLIQIGMWPKIQHVLWDNIAPHECELGHRALLLGIGIREECGPLYKAVPTKGFSLVSGLHEAHSSVKWHSKKEDAMAWMACKDILWTWLGWQSWRGTLPHMHNFLNIWWPCIYIDFAVARIISAAPTSPINNIYHNHQYSWKQWLFPCWGFLGLDAL